MKWPRATFITLAATLGFIGGYLFYVPAQEPEQEPSKVTEPKPGVEPKPEAVAKPPRFQFFRIGEIQERPWGRMDTCRVAYLLRDSFAKTEYIVIPGVGIHQVMPPEVKIPADGANK